MNLKKKGKLIIGMIVIAVAVLTIWVVIPLAAKKVSSIRRGQSSDVAEQSELKAEFLEKGYPWEDGWTDEDAIAWYYENIVGGEHIDDTMFHYEVATDEQVAEYEQSLKDTPSDIEGWSMYDKREAGLDMEEGSDTDRDGLSDKEEIEVYGTDPLKMSTTDDLYPDGYKVENGMDPLTYYEYEGEVEFPGVRVGHVKCLTATVENRYCSYVSGPYDSAYDNEDYLLYDSRLSEGQRIIGYFSVGGYVGDIEVAVDELVKFVDPENLDEDYMNEHLYIEVWDGGRGTTYRFEGNKIIFTMDLKRGDAGLAIYEDIPGQSALKNNSLVKRNGSSWFDGLSDVLEQMTENDIIEDGENGFRAVIFDFPLVGYLFRAKPTVYYVSSGDTVSDEAQLQRLLDVANETFETDIVLSWDGSGSAKATLENCKEISALRMNFLTERFSSFPKLCHCLPYTYDDDFYSALFKYMYSSDIRAEVVVDNKGEEKEEEIKIPEENYIDHITKNGFSYKNEFCFENFPTEYGNGVCAGLAYLTMYSFNNGGGLPALNGSNNVDGYDISWNVDSSSSEYQPLVSGDFYDFLDPNVDFTGNLTPTQSTFKSLVVDYWDRANDPEFDAAYDYGLEHYRYISKSNLDQSLVDEIIRRLDNGEILYLAFSISYDWERDQRLAQYLNNGGDYFIAGTDDSGNNVIVDFRQDKISREDKKDLKKFYVDGGHAVNIIGYEYDENDSNIVYFLLYDNNYPVEARQYYQMLPHYDKTTILDSTDKIATLEYAARMKYGTVLTVQRNYGNEYGHANSFDWCYFYDPTSYYASSTMPMSKFIVMDSNFNIISQ